MTWGRTRAGLAAQCAVLAALLASCGGGNEPPTVCSPEDAARATDAAGAEVTLAGLLEQMVDLDHLMQPPAPAFKVRQASSTDPRSPTANRPEHWFSNADFGNFAGRIFRQGQEEFVMMQDEGPGAIVRMWSATPRGTLRIYIDDFDAPPVIEAPFAALLTGKVPPFGGPFAYESARGGNFYFPLPYRERVRVTVDEGLHMQPPGAFGQFYHVGYRRYEAGTRVQPFSQDALCPAQEVMTRVAQALVGDASFPRPAESRAWTLAPGRPVELTASPGGAVMRELRIDASGLNDEYLRSALLTIRFDAAQTVRAPLGDFFAASRGLAEFRTLPLSASPQGWLSIRFPMPFREQATIAIEPPGGVGSAPSQDMALRGQSTLAPRRFSDDTLYFRADYRHVDTLTNLQDVRFALLQGRGQYVGNVMTVDNPSQLWWGEGDERIWVDDDPWPSFFGTGTEDYYGYAWGSTELFHRPYHAQVRAPPVSAPPNQSWLGVTSLTRFHILDSIPFRHRFRFDMELWHWERELPIAIELINYWYGRD